MLFDKNLMFWDGDATDANASSEVDLGYDGAGAGEPLKVHVNGTGMTAGTNIVVSHADVSETAYADLMDITVPFGDVNNGYSFFLPANIKRYCKLTVTLGAGGTIMAGVIKDANVAF